MMMHKSSLTSSLVLGIIYIHWQQYLVVAQRLIGTSTVSSHLRDYGNPKSTLPDSPQLLPQKKIFCFQKLYWVYSFSGIRLACMSSWNTSWESTLHPPSDILAIVPKTHGVVVLSLNSISTAISFLLRSILVRLHLQAPHLQELAARGFVSIA